MRAATEVTDEQRPRVTIRYSDGFFLLFCFAQSKHADLLVTGDLHLVCVPRVVSPWDLSVHLPGLPNIV